MSRKGIDKALRMARRKKKLAEGGVIFDPDYLGKYTTAKAPNQRVMEGHQEFEQGYGPSGSMPWEAPRWRRGINSRGQEVDIVKAADGGSIDDLLGTPEGEADYRRAITPRQAVENLSSHRADAPDPLDVMTSIAGGPSLAMAGMAPIKRALTSGIRAYHGSPYDFEKFDLSKIGTGEGAQAYGHGLYFAENEQTAKTYRDMLSDLKSRAIEGNPDLTVPSWVAKTIESRNPQAINDIRTNFQGRLAEMERQLADPSTPQPWNIQSNIPGIKNILKAVDEFERGAKFAPAGRMYEVNINAKPEKFLDWDKPLNQMSQPVQDALNRAWLAHPEAHAGQLGEQIYRNAEINLHQPGRGHLDRVLAAEKLQEAGIPGIRYLDQGSRYVVGGQHVLTEQKPNGKWEATIRVDRSNLGFTGPGTAFTKKQFPTKEEADAWARNEIGQKGTSNYVVFNPAIVDILKKYGIAGLGAGTALSNQPEEPQKQGGKISAALHRHKKKKG